MSVLFLKQTRKINLIKIWRLLETSESLLFHMFQNVADILLGAQQSVTFVVPHVLKHCNNRIEKRNEPPHDKTNKVAVLSAKTQISLGIHPVWSESSLGTQWVAKDLSFLHADSKDSV